MNKAVDIRVNKLLQKKDDSCGGVVNGFDSKGVVFYKVDKNPVGIKVFNAKGQGL